MLTVRITDSFSSVFIYKKRNERREKEERKEIEKNKNSKSDHLNFK
jgi:hypothetical protein